MSERLLQMGVVGGRINNVTTNFSNIKKVGGNDYGKDNRFFESGQR